MYLTDACTATAGFEGKIPWLYLDTRGNVTVGVGLMLPSLDTALALPFQIEGMGGPLAATPEQITNDWTRIKGLPFGQKYGAGAFHAQSSCFLTDDEIQSQLMAIINKNDTSLANGITGYDDFPNSCKVALLDMAYNLGVHGLLSGYPRLIAACELGNWTQAAAQCQRGGIGTTRNSWTVQQFMEAA